MGARKKISAEKRKEALKTMYFAKLQNVPTSPRKMRLVADMIRIYFHCELQLYGLQNQAKSLKLWPKSLLRLSYLIHSWQEFSFQA